MRNDRCTKGNLTSVQFQNSIFKGQHKSRRGTHERVRNMLYLIHYAVFNAAATIVTREPLALVLYSRLVPG